MALRVIIAGGGTGGHIFPGVAIAREFHRRDAQNDVTFIGTAQGLETKIVPREGFKLELIRVAGLKNVSMAKRIKSLLMLPGSFLQVIDANVDSHIHGLVEEDARELAEAAPKVEQRARQLYCRQMLGFYCAPNRESRWRDTQVASEVVLLCAHPKEPAGAR